MAPAGEPERLFYGYPCLLDERDQIAPLFFLEATVSEKEDGSFAIRPRDPTAVRVNHHVLRARRIHPEEVGEIQSEMEGPFGSFEARLRAAFEWLGEARPPPDPEVLHPVPRPGKAIPAWLSLPILFRSERTAFTVHLRRELDALVRFDRLLDRTPGTALGALLGIGPGGAGEEPAGGSWPGLVEICPLNDEQERAARKALQGRLVAVSGPPGTGKSQVVVDLLATAAWRGQAVLFASKNNKAVDVVRERLASLLGEEDWSLRLGSREHMERCREELLGRLAKLATPSSPVPDQGEVQLWQVDTEIAHAREERGVLLAAEEGVRDLTARIRSCRASLPPEWTDEPPGSPPCAGAASLPSSPALERRLRLGGALVHRRLGGLLIRLAAWFNPAWVRKQLDGLLRRSIAGFPDKVGAGLLQRARAGDWTGFEEAFKLAGLYATWVEAHRHLAREVGSLASLPTATEIAGRIRALKEERARLWTARLRHAWGERVRARRTVLLSHLRAYFAAVERAPALRGREFVRFLEELGRTIAAIGRDLPVWIVTSLSTRRAVPLEPGLFDLVVIDEASQCDVASAIPLLLRARRAVVIGDPRQLRHISALDPQREAELARRHGVEQHLVGWSYATRSLYDAASEAAMARGVDPIFLAEHYRSHPEIIEFSNRTFYAGRLVVRTRVANLESLFGRGALGVFWHEVEGGVPQAGRSAWNPMEAAAAANLVEAWWRQGLVAAARITLGVVTPFRLQAERIEEALEARPWWLQVRDRVRVGTAHRFQGDECDLMVFSPVVSRGIAPRLARWVAETEQLLNVAVTRARAALHVVGDRAACERAGGALGELARYAGALGIAAAGSGAFESPAEARLAELLEEVGLWYRAQYPLDRYRLDFLVISPFGRLYDVEVDGAYHRSADQLARDDVRDRGVEARGLRVLRIDAARVLGQREHVRGLLNALV